MKQYKINDMMDEVGKIHNEMRDQLKFMVDVKESLTNLEDRIRGVSLFLALEELRERHNDIYDWDMDDRTHESMVMGNKEKSTEVIGRVRTITLHGKSILGGRQRSALKKNLDELESRKADFKYLFLLDPWTVQVVMDDFSGYNVSILPLLRDDISKVVRKPSEGDISLIGNETTPQMVEEVITKEVDIPDDKIIVSPISKTSLKQGFLYIPRDKGEMLEEGPVKVWVRKDASLESKCMISKTGGVRIGGGLTKWFRSLDLQPGDELVLGILDQSSILVMMVRRKTS